MAPTSQLLLAQAARKAATDLEAALLRLPLDKRAWSPAPTSRSALDLVAECTILNGHTATVIENQSWGDFPMEQYMRDKDELARDWERLQPMLASNTERVANIITALSDADWDIEVQAPWGLMTLGELANYPYWNMSYHLGQTNYIASILGCLE